MKERKCFNCKFVSGKNCLIREKRIDWDDLCGKYEEESLKCRNCSFYTNGFCPVQNDKVEKDEMCGRFSVVLSPELLFNKRK